MQYVVTATPSPMGWTLEVVFPGGAPPPAPRQAVRTSSPDQVYPLPDPSESARWSTGPLAPFCTDSSGDAIGQAHRRIVQNTSTAEEGRNFGRYLLEVLFGARWDEIEKLTPAGEAIEIELRVAPSDVAMLRLPWEMMHTGAHALAAHPTRKVAITRIIEPLVAVVPVSAQPIPLRVLFVVGRQIDASLRPGAEFLGLLRHLKVPTDTTFKQFTSAAITVRYLGEATIDELEAAVREFEPTVVHLTCHGEQTVAGVQLLLTAREKEGDATSRKTAAAYPCSADRLLGVLRNTAGALPAVAVINACHTADVSADLKTAARLSTPAFAAKLVQGDAGGGISMAIGMAGEVEDRACQAFTIRFYQALIGAQPIGIAAAHGRRGALLEYPELQESFEWVRPTVFRAAGASDAIPLQKPATELGAVARAFRKQATFCNMVCDRYETLDLAQSFLKAATGAVKAPLVLPFASRHPSGGLGHTRLLEEIAGLAVHAGFIPCVLRSSATAEPAANLLELTIAIADGLQEAVQCFQLAAPAGAGEVAAGPVALSPAYSAAYVLASIDRSKPAFVQQTEFRKWLKDQRGNKAVNTPPFADIRQLLEMETAAALATIRKIAPDTSRLILLIDDFHRYAGLATALIDEAWAWGLGTAAVPMPLVFTYRPGEGEGKLIQDRLKGRHDLALTSRNELSAFETSIEKELVYKQLLLAEHNCVATALPTKRHDVEELFKVIHEECLGRPKAFQSEIISAVVRLSRKQKPPTVLDAKFEDVLGKWA